MAKQRLIANENIDELMEMLKWWRSNAFGGPGTPKGQPSSGTSTYLAKTPTGGIPGLSIGGDDVPGEATCSIYRLDDSGASVKIIDMGFDAIVYNISLTSVATRYAIVHQIKGGVGGYVTIDAGNDEDTGTATIEACIQSIAGIALNDLPSSTMGTGTGTGTGAEPEYALGLDTDGCLVRIPISEC